MGFNLGSGSSTSSSTNNNNNQIQYRSQQDIDRAQQEYMRQLATNQYQRNLLFGGPGYGFSPAQITRPPGGGGGVGAPPGPAGPLDPNDRQDPTGLAPNRRMPNRPPYRDYPPPSYGEPPGARNQDPDAPDWWTPPTGGGGGGGTVGTTPVQPGGGQPGGGHGGGTGGNTGQVPGQGGMGPGGTTRGYSLSRTLPDTEASMRVAPGIGEGLTPEPGAPPSGAPPPPGGAHGATPSPGGAGTGALPPTRVAPGTTGNVPVRGAPGVTPTGPNGPTATPPGPTYGDSTLQGQPTGGLYGWLNGLLNSTGYSDEEKNAMQQEAARATRAGAASAQEQAARHAAATGAGAGYYGTQARIGADLASSLGQQQRQNTIEFAREQERRRELGGAGMQGLYGVEAGQTAGLLGGLSGLATLRSGETGASTGTTRNQWNSQGTGVTGDDLGAIGNFLKDLFKGGGGGGGGASGGNVNNPSGNVGPHNVLGGTGSSTDPITWEEFWRDPEHVLGGYGENGDNPTPVGNVDTEWNWYNGPGTTNPVDNYVPGGGNWWDQTPDDPNWYLTGD